MKLQEIERLLEKYYNGETSLEEERALAVYFSQDDVPEQLQADKVQFDYLNKVKSTRMDNVDFEKEVLNKIDKPEGLINRVMENRPWFYATAGMAATILILLAIFVRFEPMPKRIQDTYSDPEMAYNEAKKVLIFVSNQFNKGTDKLKPISTYDDGMKELNKIKAFNEGITAAEKIKKYNKIEQIMTNTN